VPNPCARNRHKSSRGDRRLTFPNESVGARLLWLAMAQAQEFTADTFVTLGSSHPA
jgi:hypothetical protein